MCNCEDYQWLSYTLARSFEHHEHHYYIARISSYILVLLHDYLELLPRWAIITLKLIYKINVNWLKLDFC